MSTIIAEERKRGAMSEQPTILVIDDESSIRDILVDYLRPRGFVMEAVPSAEAAQERLLHGGVDALILDVKLPGRDGLALLETVRGRYPDLCVLIITGYPTADSAIEALRRGADDYIQKPFELDALARTLDRALERRRLRRQNRALVARLRRANRKLGHRGKELRERVDEATRNLRLLLDLARGLGKNLDIEETLESVAERARTLLRARHALVFLRAPSADRFELARVQSPLSARLDAIDGDVSHGLGEGLAGRAALFGRAMPLRLKGDALAAGDPLAVFAPTVALAVPMLWEGTAIGTLVLIDRDSERSRAAALTVPAPNVVLIPLPRPSEVKDRIEEVNAGEAEAREAEAEEAKAGGADTAEERAEEPVEVTAIWEETDSDIVPPPVDYTVEEEELALTFAAHAAVAIRNAQLYEEARRLDRLQSEFVAAVSHELRTPLTKMKATLEILDTYYGPQLDSSARDLLSISDLAVRQLEDQIELILASAEIETDELELEMSDVLAGDLADEVARRLKPVAAHKGIRIDVAVPEKPIMVRVDRARFVRALVNLLSNAVKFSEAGDPVKLEVEADNGRVCFHVVDRGIGIDPADQPHIFRRFAQIDGSLTRRVGGTGLGLSVSAALIERHGGEIQVRSRSGEGSRFTVEIPTVADVSRASQAA